MEIIIKGEPKEIAALVLAVQERCAEEKNLHMQTAEPGKSINPCQFAGEKSAFNEFTKSVLNLKNRHGLGIFM